MPYPYPLNPPPPSPEELRRREQLRRQFDREAQERQQRRDEERPLRRRALEQGPPLRDLAAALDCSCTCHPRIADTRRHEGGASCPCQVADEERELDEPKRAALIADLQEAVAKASEGEREVVADEAGKMDGVSVSYYGGLAPLLVCGVAYGRAFYLRMRHEQWTIAVAGPDRPLDNPWTTSDDPSAMVIAGGAEEFFDGADGRTDPRLVVRRIAGEVRRYLAGEASDDEGDAARRRLCSQVAGCLPWVDDLDDDQWFQMSDQLQTWQFTAEANRRRREL